MGCVLCANACEQGAIALVNGKLKDILDSNNIQSLTIIRMSVPCCGGIQRACEEALNSCN